MQHNFKRVGPRPLWLHLNAGAAMTAMACDSVEAMHAGRELIAEAMAGIQQYHANDIRPFRRTMNTIETQHKSKILVGADWAPSKEIILLVPSLINEWHIFDIEEDFSFAAYLNDNGVSPAIVEWAKVEEDISIEDYLLRHLAPMMRRLIDDGYVIKGLAGYCMGGTMIAALLSACPDLRDHIQKTCLIASPWDFSYQSHDQSMRLQTLAIQTHFMQGIINVDFVQSLFWAIDPIQILKKFRKFPQMGNKSRFVRVEDWLNEGRLVSKHVIQMCLFDWYRDNKIAKGEWVVGGEIVTPQSLGDDVMIVCASGDGLVPLASSEPLLRALPNAAFVEVHTGHIGLMASGKSVNDGWKPIAEFFKRE